MNDVTIILETVDWRYAWTFLITTNCLVLSSAFVVCIRLNLTWSMIDFESSSLRLLYLLCFLHGNSDSSVNPFLQGLHNPTYHLWRSSIYQLRVSIEAENPPIKNKNL